MTGILSRLTKNPLGLLGRAFNKLLIAPLKYRSRRGYDAARYWQDRFAKHGFSLKGVGDEGLSEDENNRMYQEAAETFLTVCGCERIDFRNARVLEIGCGNGFYTKLLAEQGVRHYVGVDITNIFFPELGQRHPDFQFSCKDVTSDNLDGVFDLILMIDVIEHITNRDGLQAAFENVKSHLAVNGVFMVSPVPEIGKRSLFYVRFWSLEDILSSFEGFDVGKLVSFRYNHMLAIRKP